MKISDRLLIIFSILLTLWVNMLNGQEIQLKSSKPFTFQSYELSIKNSVKTSKFFLDSKKNTVYLYSGSKGGYFWVGKTKTGEFKRNYVKL